MNWISLGFGDLVVKIVFAFAMLIPFRIFLQFIKDDFVLRKNNI